MATQPTRYASKTEAELIYIMRDAAEAACAMRSIGNLSAEVKYLDQMNDASTEMHRRRLSVLFLKSTDTSSRRQPSGRATHTASHADFADTILLANG